MGGNAFEDLQKLTPTEYEQFTKELLELISPLCQKIEPYIPLPQKEVHGDVDFLIVFKPGYKLQNIFELMKLTKEQYIMNNNLTANTAFRKKQIDFNITLDEAEFQRCKLYKSYGGIGAFLGLLLPSKLVKFNEDGISCCCYQEHLKLDYNVCNDVREILKFYGLEHEKYEAGFKTRKQLFDYLLNTRFLDPVVFRSKKPKWTTKLINFFQEYLDQNPELSNPFYQPCEDPVGMTLKYFQKQEEFNNVWMNTVAAQHLKKTRADKWNGKHIMQIFGVPSKNLNPIKKKFQNFLGGKESYLSFIDDHTFDQIVLAFSKACQLKPISGKAEETHATN